MKMQGRDFLAVVSFLSYISLWYELPEGFFIGNTHGDWLRYYGAGQQSPAVLVSASVKRIVGIRSLSEIRAVGPPQVAAK